MRYKKGKGKRIYAYYRATEAYYKTYPSGSAAAKVHKVSQGQMSKYANNIIGHSEYIFLYEPPVQGKVPTHITLARVSRIGNGWGGKRTKGVKSVLTSPIPPLGEPGLYIDPLFNDLMPTVTDTLIKASYPKKKSVLRWIREALLGWH